MKSIRSWMTIGRFRCNIHLFSPQRDFPLLFCQRIKRKVSITELGEKNLLPLNWVQTFTTNPICFQSHNSTSPFSFLLTMLNYTACVWEFAIASQREQSSSAANVLLWYPRANKLRTPGVLCEILLRILLMGRDFVTPETMASLSAPGSFSLIKQRGAQRQIQLHGDPFSRFQAWLLDGFGRTCCLTPPETQQCALPNRPKTEGWGPGEWRRQRKSQTTHT